MRLKLSLMLAVAAGLAGQVPADDLEIMRGFARAAEKDMRYPTTDGEPLAYYGTGDSTPRALRTTAAAMTVFATLGEMALPESRKCREWALGGFRYLFRTHHSEEYLCADLKSWDFTDGFRFAEGNPGWAILSGYIDEDWRNKWTRQWTARSAAFFPELPPAVPADGRGRYDRAAASAEAAYAASCRYRGVPYETPGIDLRAGGFLGLGHARETAVGELKDGDWIIDTKIEETSPAGSDEGVREVLRRQSRIRRLDARTAVVRERVTALKDCELPRGYRAIPFAASSVKPLAGGTPASSAHVLLRRGETLYDVTYAVGTDATALAGIAPVDLKLPVTTERDDETEFWQAKIDAVSAAGGGRVVVTPGDHIVAELELRNGVTLEIPGGSRLLAVTNGAAYRWDPTVKAELQKTGVVVAYGATNIAITGRGEICGRGDLMPRSRAEPVRWRNVFLYRCRGVRIENVSMTKPMFWTCFLRECENVHVKGIRISSHANYNNDGLDLCVSDALVEDCEIDSDDDAMVIKNFNPVFVSGNVEIRNCRLSSNASFIKFGTETFGHFRDYRIHHCELSAKTESADRNNEGSPAWPGLKGTRNGITGLAVYITDGGTVDGLVFSDITMGEGVRCPFNVRLGRRNVRADGGSSFIRGLVFERVKMTATAASAVGCYVCGVPGLDIGEVVLRDCDFRMMGFPGLSGRVHSKYPERETECPGGELFSGANPAWFLTLRHCEGAKIEDCTVMHTGDGEERPQVYTVR